VMRVLQTTFEAGGEGLGITSGRVPGDEVAERESRIEAKTLQILFRFAPAPRIFLIAALIIWIGNVQDQS
jgi:hypothetical protein